MRKPGNITILNILLCGLVAISCSKPREGTALIDPSKEEIPSGYVRLHLNRDPLIDQQSKALMQGLQIDFEAGDLIDVNGRTCKVTKSASDT